MNSKAALVKNTVLIAISKVSTQLITFLMLPLYTSLLSASDYGLVDLIVAYGGLFAPLVMLNMEMTVFRYLIDARENKEAQSKIITNAIEIVLIASAIALLAFAVVNLLVGVPMGATVALYFFASVFSGVVIQIARGLGKTMAFAISSIAIGLLGVLLNLLFVLGLNMGAAGMLLGMALGMIIPTGALAIVLCLHKSLRISARDRKMKRELLAYALPLIPNGISWWIFNASDRTVVSVILGTAANGVYAVSNKFSGILNGVWGIFNMSWSEFASVNINSPRCDSLFSEIANVSVRVFGGLSILGIALTPLAFPLLANASYNEALLYVPVLMVAGVFSIIVGFYSAIYVAKKLTKQVMYTSAVSAIINLVVNLGLVWFIEVWAAAISTLVAYLVLAIYRHYDMKKYVKIRYERFIFVKIAAIFIVVCGLYYLNNPVLNLVNVGVAVLAAVGLNWGVIGKLPGLMGAVLRKK